MSDSLRGCRAKIARAYEQLAAFQAEVLAPSQQGPAITFRQQFDPQAQTISVEIADVPDIPERWMLIVADALQNWRAALNYLTWELAILDLRSRGISRDPKRITEFPIATESARFRLDKISDLSSAHQADIERLQPYDRSNLSPHHPFAVHPPEIMAEFSLADVIERHPLRTLQRLTNTDKHQTFQGGLHIIHAVRHNDATAHDCLITHTNIFLVHVLHEGAKWAEFDVTPTGPNSSVQVNSDMSLTIAFSDGTNAFADLVRIGKEVERVVGMFEEAF